MTSRNFVENSNSNPLIQQPNQFSFSGTQSPAKTTRSSFAILIMLVFIALGLIFMPRPTSYYPEVIVDTPDSTRIDFLFTGQDQSKCEGTVTAIIKALMKSCRECTIRSQTCLKNPAEEMQQRFSETPLPVTSARIINGIITYTATNADIAMAACKESERQASLMGNQNKIACYAANAARPHTSFDKQQIQATHTAYTLLLALCGGLIASLVAAILVTYIRTSNLSVEQLTLNSHPYLEKFTLASVDALILLGTFLAMSWPTNDDINHWSQLDRTTVISHGIIIFLTLGWFWLLLEHYTRRRPFWDELREIYRVLTIMFMVSSASAFLIGTESGRNTFLIVWALKRKLNV